MLSEIHYWMFGNALLFVLDVEASIILLTHLIINRSEFSFRKHGVSLAFLIYVCGHMTFRALYWRLWHELSIKGLAEVSHHLILLFNNPMVKLASLLDITGVVMIVAVLTWNVRFLWAYATIFAVLLASISVLLA